MRRNRAVATGIGTALVAILALSVWLSISNRSLTEKNRQMQRMTDFAKRIAVIDLLSSMRSLVAAQAQVRQTALLDRDGVGVGEYAWMQELCRMQIFPLEWMPNASDATVEGGYNIRVFLPGDAQGLSWVGETPVMPDSSVSAADGRKRQWIAYAWPIEFGRTGFLCMAISEQGEVLGLDPFLNENGAGAVTTYSGSASPGVDAILLPGSESFAEAFGVARVRKDGHLWKPFP